MGVTLTKVSRLFRTQGARAVVKRTAARLNDLRRVLFALRTKPRFTTVERLLDFSFGPEAALITPAQIRSEIAGLLHQLQLLAPTRVLEIGTANGGSLFLWTRIASPDAHIISLDLPGGTFGDGYPRWKRPLYRAFALPGQTIDLMQADSHQNASLEAVRRSLAGQKLDFLFIDGDHSYAGVKKDFEMYASLVRVGGLIAFHDIAAHADPHCEVSRYWQEIRPRHVANEHLTIPAAGWAGIGVIQVG